MKVSHSIDWGRGSGDYPVITMWTCYDLPRGDGVQSCMWVSDMNPPQRITRRWTDDCEATTAPELGGHDD
jgi:hypothetical protein